MPTIGAIPVTSLALANQVQSRHEAAQARSERRMANTIAAANEDKAAKAAAAKSPADVMGGLAVASTVAAMMSSNPAALHSMTHAALSTGHDKRASANPPIFQDGDAQVARRVSSPGGSTGTGTQAGSSSTGQRGSSSSGNAFSGDADAAEAAHTAANMARIEPSSSSTAPLAAPTISANPVPESALIAGAGPGRNASVSSTQAMEVEEDAPPARPSMISGVGVRQAIASFRQNTTSIRTPMSVIAIVA